MSKTKSLPKFTFKTTKPTGKYRAFDSAYHEIKFQKQICGSITDQQPHQIRFQVLKTEDELAKESNCVWKWVTLKKQFSTISEVKNWLNHNRGLIHKQLQLHFIEID